MCSSDLGNAAGLAKKLELGTIESFGMYRKQYLGVMGKLPSKISANELVQKLEKILDKYLEEVKAPKWQPGITWKENPLKIINSFH